MFLSGITPVCSALNSMVQLYDRDMEESGALYVLTTLLSIVTMPLVIAVFERVIGLCLCGYPALPTLRQGLF